MSKSKQKEEEIKKVYTSFFVKDFDIYEEVYESKLGEAGFVIYNTCPDVPEDNENKLIYFPYSETYEDKDGKKVQYWPIVDDAVTEEAVLLPSTALEYGSVEKLIDEIKEHIHKYLDVSKNFETFSAYYILLTWVYDKTNTLPYLRALGDTGTGKSRFLNVIGRLCYKSIIASGAVTPAPIYRLIKRWRGSIVLDEADFRQSDEKNEVVTILNCGFERGRPVIRSQKDNPDSIQILPTFGPKVFATRRKFKDTALESRCLTEIMGETTRDDIPYLLPKAFFEDEMGLRNKLLMFRLRNLDKIDCDSAQKLDLGDIEPRLKQATASFAVLFGNLPEVLEDFRGFLREYNNELIEERALSYDGMIVNAIFELTKDPTTAATIASYATLDDNITTISSQDIAEYLEENYRLDKVRPATIGRHLKGLGFETKNKRMGGVVRKCIVWDGKKMDILKRRYVAVCADVAAVSGDRGGVVEEQVVKEGLSQQEKVTGIIGIIRDLEKHNNTAPIDEIKDRAYLDMKLSESDVEEILKLLKKRAVIYEPKKGRYKGVE